MTTPSIALVPSGYKATKLYSQLPTNGNGDFTVDRNSVANRVNSNGLLEEMAIDVPRLDYSDGTCPSLLTEPQSTNLVTYSNDFTNGVWVKTNSSITSNQAISPDGTQNADLMTSTLAGSYIAFSVAVADPCTFSVFAKYNTQQFIQLHSGASGSFYANFDIQNGVVGTNGSLTTNVEIEDYGNGWYRCSATFTTIAVGSTVRIGFAETLSSTWGALNSVSGNSLYLYQSQHESLSYATSPIFTSGATATRIADVVNGSGTVNDFNSSEGALFVNSSALFNDGTIRSVGISDGTGINRVNIRYNTVSNQIEYSLFVSGETTKTLLYNVADVTQYSKIAVSWKVNDLKFYINGTLVGSTSSAVMMPSNTLNQLRLDSGAGASQFYGKVKQLQVHKTALTDLEIESLTGFSSFSLMAEYLNYTIY